MDKVRKDFDSWTMRKGRVLGYSGWREDFEIWKASRESLVIELPVIYNKDWSCNASECEAMRNGIVITKHVIHAAGVRTK